MPNQRSLKFFKDTESNVRNTMAVYPENIEYCYAPYYSAKYHAAALFYPVVHAVRALRDLFKTLEGFLWLGHALFNEPKTSVPQVLQSMSLNFLGIFANCWNALFSIATFITRTVNTIFNLGYIHSTIANTSDRDTNWMIDGVATDDENAANEHSERLHMRRNLVM